jgi:hypothetical protein
MRRPLSSELPTYSHSGIERFTACPWSYAASLIADLSARATIGGLGVDGQILHDLLKRYLSEAGTDYALQECSGRPVALPSYVTEIGLSFHSWAHYYGAHLREVNKRSDWQWAQEAVEGFCYIDGKRNNDLAGMMTRWYQTWEYDATLPDEEGAAPRATYIPLVSGSFETGQQVAFTLTGGRRFLYTWHPDYARLSEDGKQLEIWDWKSGLRQEQFDPRRPPDQLRRYALAFTKLFPDIRHVRLYLLHVNPDHPQSDGPLKWELDLTEDEIPDSIITGPVAAMQACMEFPTKPGCWLCGFCEFRADCPDSEAVNNLVNRTPQDALEAYAMIEECEALRGKLTAKKAALEAIMDAQVEQRGPVPLGGVRFYGPQKTLKARIKNKQALHQEMLERGRDPWPWWQPKSVSGLAEALRADDPFATDQAEAPWVNITSTVGSANRVYVVAQDEEDGLTPEEIHERLSEINIERLHDQQAKREVPELDPSNPFAKALDRDTLDLSELDATE